MEKVCNHKLISLMFLRDYINIHRKMDNPSSDPREFHHAADIGGPHMNPMELFGGAYKLLRTRLRA